MFCPNPQCPDLVDGGVHGEYVETVTTCPVCGARLVDTPPTESENCAQGQGAAAGTDTVCGSLVAVAAFGLRQDAEVAMSLLEANGITVFESADDAGGALPHIGFGVGTRLLVPEPQVAAAVALLESTPEKA